MNRTALAAVCAAALILTGCSDDGGDEKDTEQKQSQVNKYAHLLDALAALESGEQGDDATFTPGAGPRKAAAEQNEALGWSSKSEFRFAEAYPGSEKSCIVSADAYLVTPARASFDEPLEYYLGDGDTCSYDRADAAVVYEFVTITNDGALKYRAVKGADRAPKKVEVPMAGI